MTGALPPYRSELPFTYAFGRFAVHEALRHRPEDVLLVLWHSGMPEAERQRLVQAAAAAGVPARQDDATVARLRRKGNVYSLAQVAKREGALEANANHVVLVSPSHPGNVGTAIRSLVAFGFTDLALVAPALDPWGPYVVRASVGLRFALRCQTFATLADYFGRFPAHALFRFDAEGELELEEAPFTAPFALLFGPEWQEDPPSAPARTEARALVPDPRVVTTVRIAQSRQVESLNLAISVSIAAYRAGRVAG